MFSKVTRERLTKAGFKLEKCDDGTFWVIEKEPGEEAARLLRVCGRALANFDTEAVDELILIQCDCDFSDPTLYIDGFLWKLTKRDFADIVSLLLKRQGHNTASPRSLRTLAGTVFKWGNKA